VRKTIEGFLCRVHPAPQPRPDVVGWVIGIPEIEPGTSQFGIPKSSLSGKPGMHDASTE
jgi:hypothetical protein